MKIVCVWCREVFEGTGAAFEAEESICPACRAEHFPTLPPPARLEIVDGLTPRELGLLALAAAAFVVFGALFLWEMGVWAAVWRIFSGW